MRIVRLFLKYFIVFIALIALFFSFSVLACLLPNYRIKQNIIRSIPMFEREKEDLSEHIIYDQKYYAFDSFAEILLLEKNYLINRDKPIESALLCPYWKRGNFFRYEDINDLVAGKSTGFEQNHSRYWNGNTFIQRFLLGFGNYYSIRWFYWAISSFLLLSLLLLLYKKTEMKVSFLFLFSLLAINFFTTQFSMQLSIGFDVAFFLSILILLIPENKSKMLPMLFFVFGALTQYLDFNTVPVASLGIPLITYLVLYNKSSFKELFKNIALFSILWCFSFLLSWVAKWGLTAIFTDYDSFGEALYAMTVRTSQNVGDEKFTMLDSIARNFKGLSLSFISVIISVLVLLCAFFFRQKGIKLAVILLLIGTAPYLYYILLPNAVYLHYWFMYRIQVVSILSVFFALYYLIDWEKIGRELSFVHQKIVHKKNLR